MLLAPLGVWESLVNGEEGDSQQRDESSKATMNLPRGAEESVRLAGQNQEVPLPLVPSSFGETLRLYGINLRSFIRGRSNWW